MEEEQSKRKPIQRLAALLVGFLLGGCLVQWRVFLHYGLVEGLRAVRWDTVLAESVPAALLYYFVNRKREETTTLHISGARPIKFR